MAATAGIPGISIRPPPSSTKSHQLLSRFTLHIPSNPRNPTLLRRRPLHISNVLSNPKPTALTTTPAAAETFVSRFAADEPKKGSNVLVEALARRGVTDVFAYPGSASMEIHQALPRSQLIRNVLPRHEQGGLFAAEGYARASGLPSVCIVPPAPAPPA
ncbi:hypothetical protein CsSME_00030244 [Camellia sinensis var. sinensis]